MRHIASACPALALLRELEETEFSPRAAFDIGASVLRSVFVHGFMDAGTFDLGRIMKCCNHYLQPDGRLIPMCAYNVCGAEQACVSHAT